MIEYLKKVFNLIIFGAVTYGLAFLLGNVAWMFITWLPGVIVIYYLDS